MEDYPSTPAGGYERSWELFAVLVAELDGSEGGADHARIEQFLAASGRELMRQLFQDHLDRRAAAERAVARRSVAGADGIERRRVESGRTRALASVFGKVTVERLVYRAPGAVSLRPAEAALNLPPGLHSAGLAHLVCHRVASGSFDAAIDAAADLAGVRIGKAGVERIVAAAVTDWEGFYRTQARPPAARAGQAVVITADGKGIVMRPEYRRGHGGRKKMAELACVYVTDPVRRDPGQVLGPEAMAGPVAEAKRLFASVTDTVPAVIAAAFEEAEARDPARACRRVVLVDGNRHQIDCIETEAAERGLAVHIVLDVIHVVEYVWEAARVFHADDDQAAEAWVAERMEAILGGRARTVATGIRRRATRNGYTGTERKTLDRVAGYLANNAVYMDYPHALANGWPIATGVIEGACRHLVKDRFDITGARWSPHGAEAVLKLRALIINGDFDTYWDYHQQRELERNHLAHYQQKDFIQAA